MLDSQERARPWELGCVSQGLLRVGDWFQLQTYSWVVWALLPFDVGAVTIEKPEGQGQDSQMGTACLSRQTDEPCPAGGVCIGSGLLPA